jgi:hypothetical protein
VAALALYADSEIPEYAIKELKAGPLQYLVWLHNCLVFEKKLSRTQQRVAAAVQHQPRRATTALQALAQEQASLSNRVSASLATTIGVNFDLDTWQATEIRISLRTRIIKGWKRRLNVAGRIGVKLSCYKDQEPAVNARSGELKIPGRECETTDCSMRPLLQGDLDSLKKLLDASNGQGTAEGLKRATVLSKLHDKCPALSSKDCRKLGDAIFAFFAPPSADILTTNVRDHRVLASAVGKTAVSPAELGV